MDPSATLRMTNAWSIIFANLEFRYMVAFTLAKVRLLIYSHNFVHLFSSVSSFSDTLCHFCAKRKVGNAQEKNQFALLFFRFAFSQNFNHRRCLHNHRRWLCDYRRWLYSYRRWLNFSLWSYKKYLRANRFFSWAFPICLLGLVFQLLKYINLLFLFLRMTL